MERKAFNFYKSYYEVFKMLENDEDKLQFITALLEKQFENKEPGKMLPMATFAYKSQEHNIIAQVEGFINKISHPTEGGRQGGIKGGSGQEEGKEKGEGKEKWKEKGEEKDKVEDEVELEKCKIIALKDDKWIRLAKANETELDAFNDHLILIGLNKKLPIDYKRHFVNWKKQKPEILSKINNLKRDDSW